MKFGEGILQSLWDVQDAELVAWCCELPTFFISLRVQRRTCSLDLHAWTKGVC